MLLRIIGKRNKERALPLIVRQSAGLRAQAGLPSPSRTAHPGQVLLEWQSQRRRRLGRLGAIARRGG